MEKQKNEFIKTHGKSLVPVIELVQKYGKLKEDREDAVKTVELEIVQNLGRYLHSLNVKSIPYHYEGIKQQLIETLGEDLWKVFINNKIINFIFNYIKKSDIKECLLQLQLIVLPAKKEF